MQRASKFAVTSYISPLTQTRLHQNCFKSLAARRPNRLRPRPVPAIRALATMASKTEQKHKAAMDDVTSSGRFQRKPSVFRDWIRADGSTRFAPEAGRYRLYVSMACPWACRVLAVRALKGLGDALPITVVHHFLGENGWTFVTEDMPMKERPPLCEPEPLFGAKSIRDIYFAADPEYSSRFTVPVVWDTVHKTIVNNESSEIIQMLATEFDDIATNKEFDLYPADRASEIAEVAESFYNNVNNGVYRSGFATTQDAYSEAVTEVFQMLDKLEERLAKQDTRFLMGDELTLADVRLFPTLIRFDAAYVLHFKCNVRQLKEYKHLSRYTREMYQIEAIRSTVNFEHIKNHYFRSHPTINPHRIVPNGPDLSYLDEPVARRERAA
jgi:glutathionyl-hydroquinone reductase